MFDKEYIVSKSQTTGRMEREEVLEYSPTPWFFISAGLGGRTEQTTRQDGIDNYDRDQAVRFGAKRDWERDLRIEARRAAAKAAPPPLERLADRLDREEKSALKRRQAKRIGDRLAIEREFATKEYKRV
jgi:hypothetical protein